MMSAPDAERAVGIACYGTQGEPCAGRAKSSERDFRVEEYVTTEGLTAEARADYYPLYRVEKRSIDTMHLGRELARDFESKVSYGGLKDKRALAVQYVTPTRRGIATPREVVNDRFSARLVGFVPRPISRAAVIGNRFEIILRGCCLQIESRVEEAFRLGEERRLPNYFGLQRFGTAGAGTHRVGRAMVRGEFNEAVRLMLVEERPTDDDGIRAAREAMALGKYEEGLRLLPPEQDIEAMVAGALCRRPGDWVAALRAVPVRLRRLYVQAYQSMIFNEALSEALGRGEDVSKARAGDNWASVSQDGLVTSEVHGVRDVPMVGAVPMIQLAGYAYRSYGSRFDACVTNALAAEGVEPRQFYVKEMQEVSAEGGFRRPHLAMKDVSFRVDGGVASLAFTLAKGQYATILLREIIKPKDPAEAGLA